MQQLVTFVILLLLLATIPRIKAKDDVIGTSINRDSIRNHRSIDLREERPRRNEEERIYHQGDTRDVNERSSVVYETPEQIKADTAIDHSLDETKLQSFPVADRSEYETPEQIQADTAIDHSLDGINERLQPIQHEETIPDIYDPDELSEEIAKQSIVRSSVETERYEKPYASASAESTTSKKYAAWIAHGTIAILCFGLLVPASISSALFREAMPEYWIYIHVFLNVATFVLVTVTVGVAFATMNSLGDKKEGHLKELHHVVGLFLLFMVSFQTVNGFLRPPREFVTEDGEDFTPGAIHSSDWERSKFTPRTLWHLVHRATGVFIFALGTWQIQSGMAIYARKYSGADWGSVYLGYVGWLVFVIGGVKLWMMYKNKNRDSKDPWNVEDELFMDPDD